MAAFTNEATDTSRSAGAAPWRRIADALRREIGEGIFLPGGRLPNDTVIADRFGVKRPVVHQALEALSQEGLIRIEPDQGVFVTGGKLLTSARFRKDSPEPLDASLGGIAPPTHAFEETLRMGFAQAVEAAIAKAHAAGLAVPGRDGDGKLIERRPDGRTVTVDEARDWSPEAWKTTPATR